MAIPRYKITEPCYIDDKLYDPNSSKDDIFIEHEGRPGRAWEPQNDEAREMWAKFKPNTYDPIRAMTSLSGKEEKSREQIEAEVRADIEAQVRKEQEVKLRAEIEAQVRAEMDEKSRAEAEAAASNGKRGR